MRYQLLVLLSGAVMTLPMATVAGGQGKGQGAIVVRDTDRKGLAPIYAHEDNDRIEAKAARGDYVGGITTVGLVHQYQFEHKNGRLHVIYFANVDQTGLHRTAWMDEADLATFTYECGCGFGRHRRGREEEACSPLALEGFVSRTWNACFQEARDRKLAELKVRWAQEASGASAAPGQAAESSPGSKSVKKALTNEDVVAMVKAGLGDKIVIAKIQQAETVNLDSSPEALVQLKKAGVSQAVIEAVMKRASP